MTFASAVLTLMLLFLLPDQASAHGGLPGGGGFYSGAAHPLLAVEQLLALLAYGLLLGQQPGPFSRLPLAGLALGLVGGLTVGLGSDHLTLATLALGLLLGCLLAAALCVPVGVLAAVGGIAGWIIAADTDVPPVIAANLSATNLTEIAAPSAGVFVGVFLIVLNAAALGSLARKLPFAVALRIAGSWIAAIGLMVLALRLRGVWAV